ncbi:MAG: NifU family protein [Lachnospiraceae bacterium]|nr:NifU family protein [Lachnospiraceae bacterium]
MEFELIEKVIEEKVRPALLDHNGDIKISSYKNGILSVSFMGNCMGCPSAMLTVEEIVKKEVMEACKEVKDVVLVQDISEETLDLAKQILNHSLK